MAVTIFDKIDEIENVIKNDTFNLTRHDQDAICTRIEQLKQFIQDIYEQHKRI